MRAHSVDFISLPFEGAPASLVTRAENVPLMLTPKEEQANVQNGFGAPVTVIAVAWRDGAVIHKRPEQCRESQRQVDIAHGSA